jgi:hypothetical protein
LVLHEAQTFCEESNSLFCQGKGSVSILGQLGLSRDPAGQSIGIASRNVETVEHNQPFPESRETLVDPRTSGAKLGDGVSQDETLTLGIQICLEGLLNRLMRLEASGSMKATL